MSVYIHVAIQEVNILFNIPSGMEPNTMRMQPASFDDGDAGTVTKVKNEEECFANCDVDDDCDSWTYFPGNNTCISHETMKLNTYSDEAISGIQTDWELFDGTELPPFLPCVSKQNPGYHGSSGDMSACVVPITNHTMPGSVLVGKTLQDIWSQFKLHPPSKMEQIPDTSTAYGAITARANKLMPHESQIFPFVLSWNYPHRDFVGKVYGNHYSTLFKDSKDVAVKTVGMMNEILDNITAMHSIFFDSSLPDFLKDLYVNSLSHIRSAMWFYDGRWRQWEANDCTNIGEPLHQASLRSMEILPDMIHVHIMKLAYTVIHS